MGSLLEPSRIAGEDRDIMTARREFEGRCAADAGVGAGDGDARELPQRFR
jgi:hypothetical protein